MCRCFLFQNVDTFASWTHLRHILLKAVDQHENILLLRHVYTVELAVFPTVQHLAVGSVSSDQTTRSCFLVTKRPPRRLTPCLRHFYDLRLTSPLASPVTLLRANSPPSSSARFPVLLRFARAEHVRQRLPQFSHVQPE